jgi:hypothetical protein
MGIDFSNNDAHWGYSGFNIARARLAAEIGIGLDRMQGFIRDETTEQVYSWSKVIDPIKPLLDHSDCDGELTPDECRTVAPRLRELISYWPDDYDKANFLELARGMDIAVSENKPLIFR